MPMKFCPRCETMHAADGPCSLRGLKLKGGDTDAGALETTKPKHPNVAQAASSDVKMPPDAAPEKLPGGKFDRVAYQRAYVRDWRRAKKRGLTVAEYRIQRDKP